MTVHVAEAGEQRGRVVLKIGCTQPSQVVLEAAVRIAQAFHSEIESLFVEEPQVIDAARFAFTREISLVGGRSRELTAEAVERQLRHAAREMAQRIAELARLAEVPTRATVVRDEPIDAMERACREYGPWNVIALADRMLAGDTAALRQLFERGLDVTGVVVAGPNARTMRGPVIAAVEDMSHLETLLRTARRLAVDGVHDEVVLVLVADEAHGLAELEGQVRLVLGGETVPRIVKANPAHGSPLGPLETLRRLRGGFVIAQYGGRLLPATDELRLVVATLECPIFIVR